eukprot:12374116-Karenia_brevis.AAC.1
MKRKCRQFLRSSAILAPSWGAIFDPSCKATRSADKLCSGLVGGVPVSIFRITMKRPGAMKRINYFEDSLSSDDL